MMSVKKALKCYALKQPSWQGCFCEHVEDRSPDLFWLNFQADAAVCRASSARQVLYFSPACIYF